MANVSSKSHRLLFLAVAMTASFSSSSWAGFEWRGPLSPPPASMPMPNGEVNDMQGMEPVITWGGESGAPDMPAVKAGAVEQVPVSEPVVLPGAVAESAPVEPMVEGFGKDVPLPIAVQQIAPAGYQVSFGEGVDAGTTVSWQGGQTWKQVLTDALAVKGLVYTLQENTMTIRMQAPPAAAKPEASAVVAPPKEEKAQTEPISPAPVPKDEVAAAPAEDVGTQQQAPATSAEAPKTVDIRRDRAKSFLERIGLKRSEPTQEEQSQWGTVTTKQEQSAEDMPAKVVESKEKDKAAGKKTVDSGPQAWKAEKGQMLRDVLRKWSKKAGVEMYWAMTQDYKLEQDFSEDATYEEVVDHLLNTFSDADPKPYGRIHQQPEGVRVLVVKAQ